LKERKDEKGSFLLIQHASLTSTCLYKIPTLDFHSYWWELLSPRCDPGKLLLWIRIRAIVLLKDSETIQLIAMISLENKKPEMTDKIKKTTNWGLPLISVDS
jgi:hypothetical protein